MSIGNGKINTTRCLITATLLSMLVCLVADQTAATKAVHAAETEALHPESVNAQSTTDEKEIFNKYES